MGLSIDPDKTKIMIFTKNGQKHLDCVNQYKYLGVNVSPSGKLITAKITLSLKARRVLFSIKRSIHNNNIRPSAVLKIFDALAKPNALFNSEVWVGFNLVIRKD